MLDSVECPSVTVSLCAQSFQTRPLDRSGHNKQHLLCFVKWKSDSEEMFAAYVLGWTSFIMFIPQDFTRRSFRDPLGDHAIPAIQDAPRR